MGSFASWAAALAGFRLAREKPLAVLAWTAVIFVGRLGASLVTVALAGPSIAAMDAAMNAKAPDMETIAEAYQQVAPGYLAGAAVVIPFMAVVTAAVYRAYLRPQERRFAYLRLGRRELAMLGLIVSMILMVSGGFFLVGALVSTLAVLASSADPALGGLVEFVGVALALFGAVWVLARLSPAWPLTFERGRVSLFRVWPFTREQAWSVLGGFVIAEGLMVLVGVLVTAVAVGLGGALTLITGRPLDQMADMLKTLTVAEVVQPLPLFFLAFESAWLALFWCTVVGVAVSAYHGLVPRDAVDPATRVWR